ncbi:UNKNOWN [Stylonychia lemnae]|uniref:Uncharacterized protein n=1 Tax=Stylonychia lemnae TaxID=5949 RepID=A0A078B2R2_STYLE|nr:UNKNOWN [Stylonychia lemnae]|eukprot:CDW88526.1 UNKNOWN [Stylonychia lemnae]
MYSRFREASRSSSRSGRSLSPCYNLSVNSKCTNQTQQSQALSLRNMRKFQEDYEGEGSDEIEVEDAASEIQSHAENKFINADDKSHSYLLNESQVMENDFDSFVNTPNQSPYKIAKNF